MSGLLFGPRNSSNFSIIVNNTSSSEFILETHRLFAFKLILPGWYMFPLEAFVGISLEMFEELHYLEQSFIKFHNLYAFMSQVSCSAIADLRQKCAIYFENCLFLHKTTINYPQVSNVLFSVDLMCFILLNYIHIFVIKLS